MSQAHSATTLLPDYAFRAVENALTSGAAGLIGCAFVFVFAVLTGAILTRTAKVAA
ncbi:PDGLE domain-containing protein [Butyricicoccus sp.]